MNRYQGFNYSTLVCQLDTGFHKFMLCGYISKYPWLPISNSVTEHNDVAIESKNLYPDREFYSHKQIQVHFCLERGIQYEHEAQPNLKLLPTSFQFIGTLLNCNCSFELLVKSVYPFVYLSIFISSPFWIQRKLLTELVGKPCVFSLIFNAHFDMWLQNNQMCVHL